MAAAENALEERQSLQAKVNARIHPDLGVERMIAIVKKIEGKCQY